MVHLTNLRAAPFIDQTHSYYGTDTLQMDKAIPRRAKQYRDKSRDYLLADSSHCKSCNFKTSVQLHRHLSK